MKRIIVFIVPVLIILVSICGSCIFHPLPPFNNPNDPLAEGEEDTVDGNESDLQFSRDGVIQIYFEKIELGQQVGIGFSTPRQIELFSDINGIEEGWISTPLQYYQGEQITMYIDTELSETDFFSTDSSRCIVTEKSEGLFELNWEDWDADDYNDIIVELSITDYFQIPEKTITIDGKKDDWFDIAPATVDEVGDNVSGADVGDIGKVYIAKDSNNFYWRMDTAGNSYDTAGNMEYRLYFKQNLGNSTVGDKGLQVHYSGGSWETIGWDWNGSTWVDMGIPSNYAEVNATLEMKIDLSYFAGYTFSVAYSIIFDSSAGDEDGMDSVKINFSN